ncbi:MAG: S8 family serine peptidase [Pseudomonadota bacterium]
MSVKSSIRFRWMLAPTLLLAFALSACDQRSERVDRARTVIDGAIEQALGETPPPDAMESVAVEDRAFAGTVMAEEVFTTAAIPPARFAVGSIIAKPRDVPPLPSPEEALLMQAPEVADELDIEPQTEGRAFDDNTVLRSPPVATRGVLETGRDSEDGAATDDARSAAREMERAETVIKGSQSELRSLRQRLERRRLEVQERVGGLPDVSLDEATLPEARIKLAKRALPSPQTIERQVDARSKMLDVIAEFGLSGQVELNRTGQMVVQIGDAGADPTQFVEGRVARQAGPDIATDGELVCPDRPDPALIQEDKALATQCVLERLAASGEYEYVEKDFIFDHQFVRRPPATPVSTVTKPDDPLWTLQWHFQNNGSEPGTTPGGAGFLDFWTRQGTQGSSDVVVAVVDTGLDLSHPDIRDSLNVAPGWDMVSDPSMGNDGDGRDPDPDDPGDLCDPTDPFAEDSFHGTHVAGTIGANLSNNSSGVAGGAWTVTVVPVRALGKCGGRLTDINDAIRWAGGLVPAFDSQGSEIWNENPADIINLSIGLFEFCPASLQEAINAVTERGVVVVSAAGNARVPTEFYAPGGCQNVVTVAAGDARGVITPYSNYGSEVDVLAPGGDLTRDDNGDGRPDGVLSTKRASGCADPVTGESVDTCNYAFEQGTSMAAPHVSAALALMKSKDPSLFGTELRDRLLASLDPRTGTQCAGRCDLYQGFPELPDQPGQCARPCGGGLLNLANLVFSSEEGSDD